MVLLKPCSTDCVQPRTVWYTSICVDCGPSTASYAHWKDFFPSWVVTLRAVELDMSTTVSPPYSPAYSLPFKGRTRTSTLMLSGCFPFVLLFTVGFSVLLRWLLLAVETSLRARGAVSVLLWLLLPDEGGAILTSASS